MDPLKPFEWIWMVVQLATNTVFKNGITMCVQNQWAFLKVEILNSFKWSISRRVKGKVQCWQNSFVKYIKLPTFEALHGGNRYRLGLR